MSNKVNKNVKNDKVFKKVQQKEIPTKGNTGFWRSGKSEGGCNDITWWNQNPQLLRDAASISYANLAGLPLSQLQVMGFETKDQTIPGIMRFDFIPVCGPSLDGNSPVNNASRLLYSWVRHANSGSRNYEQSDLFTYILGVSQLLTAHAVLSRIYGLVQVYSKTNRYVGKALIESLGFMYNDVVKNAANLRYAINVLATKINSLAIPKSMYLFARHIMLSSSVFKDAKDTKAQMYVFVPSHLFIWRPESPTGVGSALEPYECPWRNIGACTVNAAVDFVNDLINAMSTNEDLGIMSGDTLKSLGEEGLYHINSLPEDYAVLPVYDEVMLAQIHNATIVGYPSNPDDVALPENNWWVYQEDDGNLYFTPSIKAEEVDRGVASSYIYDYNQIIDSGMEDPTPEFNMEASRLKATYYITGDGARAIYDSFGTEIITNCQVLRFNTGTDELATFGVLKSINMYQDVDGSQFGIDFANLEKFYFDWAPITYYVYFRTPETVELHISGELFNYAVIDNELIRKMNTAALLSALNVYSLAMAKANK